MNDFDTFTTIKNGGDWGNLSVALKSCPMSNKSPNLVTLMIIVKKRRIYKTKPRTWVYICKLN